MIHVEPWGDEWFATLRDDDGEAIACFADRCPWAAARWVCAKGLNRE